MERDVTVYHAGELAYLDSFAGLLPVSVLEVITPGDGWQVAPSSGEISIRMNVTRGGYCNREVITRAAHNVVPRKQVIKRDFTDRINSDYRWE
jgi:hypothetical protein